MKEGKKNKKKKKTVQFENIKKIQMFVAKQPIVKILIWINEFPCE